MLSPLYLALFENVLIGFLFLTETLNLICSLLKYFFLIVFIFATMSPDIVGSAFLLLMVLLHIVHMNQLLFFHLHPLRMNLN